MFGYNRLWKTTLSSLLVGPFFWDVRSGATLDASIENGEAAEGLAGAVNTLIGGCVRPDVRGGFCAVLRKSSVA
jgi:hypothetical protein